MTEEIKKIQTVIEPIFKSAGFSYGGIFGSFARGEANSKSDIDLLYDYAEGSGLSFFELLKVKRLLEKTLDRKVDLVKRGNVKPRVIPYVEKDLITIYEKR